jgi:DNA-directed RNA polymerase specialized sigma24 family protein
VSPSLFGNWMNLKLVPTRLTQEQEQRIVDLTGKTPEMLWPEYVRSKDFLDAPKSFSFVGNIEARKMLEATRRLRELPAITPEAVFNRTELREHIEQALSSIQPKYAQAIRARFLEDKNYDEIAVEGFACASPSCSSPQVEGPS